MAIKWWWWWWLLLKCLTHWFGQSSIEELEGKYSLESTDPHKSEIRTHLHP